VSMRGGGDLGGYIFLILLTLLLSLSRLHNSLTVEWERRSLEKPTSALLIAPVDTITPVPLLYHVRTFYIVRYNSSTTHPSHPTYTINELQKKEKKKKQRRIKIKKATNKQIHTSTQTKYNVHIHIIIKIITIMTSTTNIHIHLFKRHSTS